MTIATCLSCIMIETQEKKLRVFLLFVILTICDCQEQLYHVKPDSCSQAECCFYPHPDCLTLSEYALSNDITHSLQYRFVLTSGDYYLNSTFAINGTETESFSLIGSGSESTNIICTQKDAVLKFDGLSALTVESVAFASCGGETEPGVSLRNIDTVNLIHTSFSNSTSGALDIESCSSVQLTNLLITNNHNSRRTIVTVKNSVNVTLRDLIVVNNSIGMFDSSCVYSNFLQTDEVVFRIDSGHFDAGNIRITDNIGPFGVLVMTNAMVTVNGNWMFERNQVCVGGSLGLNRTMLNFNGSVYFVENKGMNQNNDSTAGLLLNNALLRLSGSIEFIKNEGRIASFHCSASQIIIKGSFNMTNNFNSRSGGSLLNTAKLIINGSLIVHDNVGHNRVILCDTSEMRISGVVSVINNPVTPITSSNSKMVMNGQIEFENNSGIIYAGNSEIQISGNSTFTRNSIFNDFTDGTLSVVQSFLSIEGTYTFKDCYYDDENGGGIFASIVSTVRLGGTGYFINNTANNGGGIFIDQQSRLELQKGTRLYFLNNTAVRGAGIFISTSLQHAQCQSNPNECLFGLEGDNDPDVSLTFQHNKAYPGASVIHVNFDHIGNRDIEYPALDALNRTVNVSLFIGNTSPRYASDTYWFCFCEDDSRENCIRNDPPANLMIIKGKPFSIRARALKFYGSNMSEPVRASLESSLNAVDSDSSVNSSLTANNGRLQSVSATICSNFSYTVKSTADNEIMVLNVGETFIGVDKSLRVNIDFNPLCPPGFPFNDVKDSCECDKSIKPFLRNCEITDKTFQKRIEYTNYWMAPSNNQRFPAEMSWYDNCPNQYCITNGNFSFSDDGICANKRSGLLCGQCKGNYSLLLGGDKCGDCSDNSYLAFIAVFAASGLLLIVFIFLTQMTVTTGTINGLIFYANILNSNQSVFFPEDFFRGYQVFISWLNLNFGFETCFFDTMDQIVYSGLQFVFPVYMWLLAGVVIILCRYSIRVSKFFGNSDPVAVLATIIILSFNSLVHNVVSIFYYSSLFFPSDQKQAVWRNDGNVSYGSGNHLILILIATVFILFLLLPYTFVLLSAPLLQKSERISKILRKLRLQPFIHAYLIPFKPQHRYWVGLSVLTRAILLILFAFGEVRQLNLLFIVTACIVAISMFSITGGIYDKSWIDKLEMSFLINLGVLAAATSFFESNSRDQQRGVATYISITIALITFIGIVIFHSYLRLKKLVVIESKKTKNEETVTCKQTDSPRTTASYNMELLREPLVEVTKLD